MTAPEALLVASAVLNLPEPLQTIIRARLRNLADQVEKTDDRGTDNGLRAGETGGITPAADAPRGIEGPCPLLEGGRCATYAARPLICRAYGFSAYEDGGYFGCEVLYPALAAMTDPSRTEDPSLTRDPSRTREVKLTSLSAGRAALPTFVVLDASGRALPECGMLAELVDRLLDSPDP